MDFVVVCFKKELKLLQLQARSIELMVSPDLIGQYYMIINDIDTEYCMSFINREILPELDWLKDRIRVVSSVDLGIEASSDKGWIVQQALKLLISRQILTSYYLVLDAKNHFIRTLKHRDLFDENGTPRARVVEKKEGSRQYELLQNSLRYFGLPMQLASGKTGVTVTPYIMITEIVNEMVDEIIIKEKGDILSIFDVEKGKMPTEFFLYYAYVAKNKGNYSNIYSCTLPGQSTLFKKYPSSKEEVEQKIEAAEKGKSFLFAVHRERFKSLEAQHLQRITRLWKNAGLINEGEEKKFTYYDL